MMIIQARNVNDAYVAGCTYMRNNGVVEDSRLGPVKVAPTPVMTVYEHPWERVLFDPVRNTNPFFHLAECVWMMAGGNNIQWLARFNKQMLTYSDDGVTTRGAYGHRWRKWFGADQLWHIVARLRKDSKDRKAVLAMWDPEDLTASSMDIPCNTHIYFRVNQGALDMTVMCRSNDMIWGAYGANAVHFSFLQEYVASALGIPMGRMYQLSNNFHIYEHHWSLLETEYLRFNNPYAAGGLDSVPIAEDVDSSAFLLDCESIVGTIYRGIKSHFLRNVAIPMFNAWHYRRQASMYIGDMPDCDWKLAATQWLDRAVQRKEKS